MGWGTSGRYGKFYICNFSCRYQWPIFFLAVNLLEKEFMIAVFLRDLFRLAKGFVYMCVCDCCLFRCFHLNIIFIPLWWVQVDPFTEMLNYLISQVCAFLIFFFLMQYNRYRIKMAQTLLISLYKL